MEFSHQHVLVNPVCGDRVELKLRLDGDLISAIGFSAKACAVCAASTSILSEIVEGQSVEWVRRTSLEFEDQVLASVDSAWPEHLAGLQSFEHLKVNPARRACALLPWIALRSALKELS